MIAAHLNPTDSEEWAKLAVMSLNFGKTKEAIACYDKGNVLQGILTLVNETSNSAKFLAVDHLVLSLASERPAEPLVGPGRLVEFVCVCEIIAAIKYAKDNKVELLWARCALHEMLGETRRVFEGFQMVLKSLPKDSGEKYVILARDITKVTRDFSPGSVHNADHLEEGHLSFGLNPH